MKKILLALFAVTTLFTACESTFNDQFEGLEESTHAPYIDAQEIVLTSDHYAAITKAALKDAVTEEDSTKAESIADNEYFSDDVKSVDYIPYLLNIEYNTFDKGAPCVVTFNYNAGKPSDVTSYVETSEYTITDADYESVGGDVATYHVFLPESPAVDHIPTLLAASQTTAVAGDRLLVNYGYTDDVSNLGVSYNLAEKFALTADDYQIIVEVVKADPSLSKYVSSYGTNEYYYGASSYHQNFSTKIADRRTYADDVYTVSMSDTEVETLIEEKLQESLVILLETKFPAAVEEIDGETVYYQMNYKFYDGSASGYLDIVYKVIPGSSPVSFELVAGPVVNEEFTSSSSSEKTGIFYLYDGTDWAPETGVYYLSSEDYESMGIDKFSYSKPADNYLPSFLNTKYPYAQNGDQFYIGYRYYDDLDADIYTYDNGWSAAPSVVETAEQYVFKQVTWIFDPSVTFEMTKDDYETVVNFIKNDPTMDKYMDEDYDTQEYYYGAGYYFGNFDVQLYKRQKYDAENFPADISEDDAAELMEERIVEAIHKLLKEKYPDAVTTVNGADVFYNVDYQTYSGGGVDKFYTVKFQCTSVGDFTLVDSPVENE